MLKRQIALSFATLVALLLAGCGDGDDQTLVRVPVGDPPPPLTAVAAVLAGSQEVPVVATEGWGRAVVDIEGDMLSLTASITVAGLEDVTAAHIHLGDTGQNGPVMFTLAAAEFGAQLTIELDEDDLVPLPAEGIETLQDAIDAILDGRTYVNVHTRLVPSGELRGQLGAVVLTADLSGDAEVPPVVTTGGGTFELTLSDLQDGFMTSLEATGITGLNAVHVHVGDAGTNGPIVFTLAEAPGLPLAFPQQYLISSFTPAPTQGIRDAADLINAMLSGRTYVNLHTDAVPSGELRGQLLP